MIKISFYANGLTVLGHANYANKGQDIICAGVSAIVFGALNWFIENDVQVWMPKEGSFKLEILNCNPTNLNYLSLIKKQLYSLNSDEYSQYLSFSETDKKLS